MNSHSYPVSTLLSGLILTLVPGCWTSDAHVSDAGKDTDVIDVCGLSKNICFDPVQPNAQGDWADLRANSFLISGVQSPQINVFPGPDNDAGNPEGLVFGPGSDGVFRITGSVPAAAGWNISGGPAPDPVTTLPVPCPAPTGTRAYVPATLARGIRYDASNFEGLRIQLGGDIGPPKIMELRLDSFGTPEDPYRQQTLSVKFTVPRELTTFNFKWSDFTAPCGKSEYFKPESIISISAVYLPLTGSAYDFTLEIGALGFIPKSP